METDRLISIYQTQVGLVDKIWAYFYSVTFALLGATLLTENVTLSYTEVIFLCGGYLVFSFGSGFSLWHAQGDICLFGEKVKFSDSSFSLSPISQIKVLLFQVVIVVIVTVATFITYSSRIY